MQFRKDRLLMCQHLIGFALLFVVTTIMALLINQYIILLFSFIFLVLLLLTPKQYNQFVTIDKDGIRCSNHKNLLWEYNWNEIVELKTSNRYMLPSIEVIACEAKGKVNDGNDRYFQLSKAAKRALSIYGNNQTNY